MIKVDYSHAKSSVGNYRSIAVSAPAASREDGKHRERAHGVEHLNVSRNTVGVLLGAVAESYHSAVYFAICYIFVNYFVAIIKWSNSLLITNAVHSLY